MALSGAESSTLVTDRAISQKNPEASVWTCRPEEHSGFGMQYRYMPTKSQMPHLPWEIREWLLQAHRDQFHRFPRNAAQSFRSPCQHLA